MTRKHRSNSLNIEQQEKLLDNTLKYEDLALFKLALSTGIRREDIVNIEIANINFEERKLKFWQQKKKKYHTVPLTTSTVTELKRYLSLKDPTDRYLFKFSGRTAYNKLQRGLKEAGIGKKISFHDLRRSFTKTAKLKGIPITAVAQILDDTITTVQEFYSRLDIEELNQEVDKL